MKFLRHILSHLFLIAFLLAVVSVFYYRTLLLPDEVVGKIDGYVNDIYPPAVKFASKRDYFWSIRGERIVSFDDLNFFEKKDEEKSDTVAVADRKEMQQEKVKAEETKPEKTTEVVAVKQEETVAETIAAPAPVKDDVAALPVEVKDSDTSSERDLLIAARNAFNQGKIKQSENLYIELTQLEQDNPDAFGELGNIYYSQGEWDKAGQAYYEAAVRLISSGKSNQVAYLHNVIKGLSAEQAEKLSQLMLK